MSMRDEFEKAFPVPLGVKWCERQQDYTYENYRALDSAASYSGKWKAYQHGLQAARSEGGQEVVADGEPLPCPFCGGKPAFMPHPDPTYPQVQCRNIECPIGVAGDEVSLESWNERKYTHPQSAQTGVPHWKDLNALADEYVDGYEFRGDEGDYQPTDRERFLIEDCVAGLMDEVHQMLKRATPQPEGDWVKWDDGLPPENGRNPVWYWDNFQGLMLIQEHEAYRRLLRSEAHNPHWKPTGLKRPTPPSDREEG